MKEPEICSKCGLILMAEETEFYCFCLRCGNTWLTGSQRKSCGAYLGALALIITTIAVLVHIFTR